MAPNTRVRSSNEVFNDNSLSFIQTEHNAAISHIQKLVVYSASNYLTGSLFLLCKYAYDIMETLDGLLGENDSSYMLTAVKRFADLKMTTRKEGRRFLTELRELYNALENVSGKELVLKLVLTKLQAPEQGSMVATLSRQESFSFEELERMCWSWCFNLLTPAHGSFSK
ncbi:hypothetical protein V1511DRAFT_490733 [Dipodascopsis uninucleata]